jgi:hypothetical protein
MADAPGVGLAVADDALNQLFAGLWASGALDLGMPIEPGHPLGLLLDEKTRAVQVHMSLPPTVSTDAGGDMGVAIGDLMLTCLDESGEELSRIAVSLATTLGAEPSGDGHVKLRLGTPAVHAQVLWQSDTLERPMLDEQVEGLVESVWSLLGPVADDVLAEVPMPSIAGVTIAEPTVESRSGFVVVQAAIADAP